jgi:HlyD family secretion protein
MKRWSRNGAASTCRAGAAVLCAALAGACEQAADPNLVRASGYVEATEVRVASEVPGRLLALRVAEGDRVQAGDLIAQLDTTDAQLAIRRAEADREQAVAQLALLRAGARPEEIRQAEAQVQAAEAEIRVGDVEVAAASRDLERFEALLRSNSGSRKQRDDAAARVDAAKARVEAAQEALRGARQVVARLRAGARPQEIAAARARVAAVEAQMAALQESVSDAAVTAPAAGIVTEKLANTGELLAARAPIVVITDLDRAWANVYVDEPIVPRLRIGQPARLRTDAGGDSVPGTITFVSPRAEFTPRNVQTAEERSKLVYRIKVTVDNRTGLLKQGMPVEAEIPLPQPAGDGQR